MFGAVKETMEPAANAQLLVIMVAQQIQARVLLVVMTRLPPQARLFHPVNLY